MIDISDDIERFGSIGLLGTLLIDRTTCNSIIWASDNYSELGDGYLPEDPITPEKVTKAHAGLIRARSDKNKDERKSRTKKHAEVATPTKIVKRMVDEIDKTRESTDWEDYVRSTVLEITCGEGPFLVNRYDAVEGVFVPLDERTGVLDRKLALVGENTHTRESWMAWATVALQSTYGYEYQGDNLLIARVNVLDTMDDYFRSRGYGELSDSEYLLFAKIIGWNLWQMDGLTDRLPKVGHWDEGAEPDECIIFDWKEMTPVKFSSIKVEDGDN